MRIRILLLLLGIVGEGWAQCPVGDKVLGTRQTGKFAIKVDDPNGSILSVSGTNNDVLKICAGQTLYVEDQTTGGKAELAGYYFNYKDPAFDLTTDKEPEGKVINKYHLYNTPGTYGLILVGADINGGYYACKTVQVFAKPNPQFEVSTCNYNEATLTLPKSADFNPYDEFIVDWGDGITEKIVQGSLPFTKSHLYSANPSGKVVTVTGSYQGNSCSNNSQYPIPKQEDVPDKPVITLLELSSTKTAATLQFASPTSSIQEIYKKEPDGTYTNMGVQVPGGTSSYLVKDLNPSQQYCFHLRSVGGCASTSGSDEICTLPITVQAKGKQIEVNWSAYPQATADFESYTVTNGTTTFPVIKDRNQTQLTDQSELECGTSYCYRVTARVNNINSISNEVCEEIESTVKPGPLTQAYATLAGKVAVLTWESPGGKILDYEILRAEAGGKFEKVEPDTTIVNPYKDRQINPLQRSYCYQISYESACKTWSNPSSPVCTIYLTQKSGELSWTNNNPFTENISEYTVQALDAQGNVVASSNVAKATKISINSLSFPISPDYQYRIESTSESGNTSWSNPISIRELFQVYVPDAFTPNGDSQNDVFLPKVVHVNALKFTVFDRWGNSIFSTEDESEGWDGYINGKPAPQGSYSYRLDVRNEVGDSFTKRGVFRLIR